MPEVKTKPTQVTVAEYLSGLSDEARRQDCAQVVALIQRITGEDPVMWGTGIVGFGSYHYKYASGCEGDTMKIGVAGRREHLVLYGVIFYDRNTELLGRLGKHKQGKGCLYIKRLSDVDLEILEQMIRTAYHATSSYCSQE